MEMCREIDFHVRHMICLEVWQVHLIGPFIHYQTTTQLVLLSMVPKLD